MNHQQVPYGVILDGVMTTVYFRDEYPQMIGIKSHIRTESHYGSWQEVTVVSINPVPRLRRVN